MIGIYKEYIHQVPGLVVVQQDKKDEALPLIIYFHGITSAKEHNLPIAYLLAEQGYRVILPDSMLHGERETATDKERQLAFWEIVKQNVKELAEIKNYFEERSLIQDGKIAVSGTSMGGITTAAAMTQYEWIQTAAVLMGTPKLTTFMKQLIEGMKAQDKLQIDEEEMKTIYEETETYDLSMHVNCLQDRPVLFWHGEQDNVVPFNLTYTFYEEVKNQYKTADRIRFLTEKNRGHKVSRYAILETVKWFQKYL
ncbi:alpha/beta fold hydrolase [Ornithinibacillus sp. 4-3]|uniref:Alpha/beta fold hydrolase n=1 Tax=Ornithinibacillus sp. 4-3 TaxID=3231488 RepID=A0AB39HT39_9BACI